MSRLRVAYRGAHLQIWRSAANIKISSRGAIFAALRSQWIEKGRRNKPHRNQEGTLSRLLLKSGQYPAFPATPWILRTYWLVSPSRIVHVNGEEVSIVWARHLHIKHEPRLSGNGDLMDTRQERRGHFVDHYESGRKKKKKKKPRTVVVTGYKLPQIGLHGERKGSQSTVWWLSVTLVGYARLILAVPGQVPTRQVRITSVGVMEL